ncbi:hypothetical protein Ancab_020730 [Ancistrocladus abbreviatus]
MASESDAAETQSTLERLMSSRNGDLSLFIPFILGFNPTINLPDPDQNSTNEVQNSPNPEQNSSDPPNPESQRDRIILINPLTQGMVVIEGADLSSLLQSMPAAADGKSGQPPASKAAIEAMPSVEIREGEEDGECVICLEDWEVGTVAKEMPCKHKFHGNCIEKWLWIHGTCPICRYKMPVEEEDEGKKSDESEGGREGERRRRGDREIWVSFSFGSSRRRNGDGDRDHDQTASIDSDHSSSGDAHQASPSDSNDSS